MNCPLCFATMEFKWGQDFASIYQRFVHLRKFKILVCRKLEMDDGRVEERPPIYSTHPLFQKKSPFSPAFTKEIFHKSASRWTTKMHTTKNLPADITSRLLPGRKSGSGPVNLFLSKQLQRVRLISIPIIHQICSCAILPRVTSFRWVNWNKAGGIVPLKSFQTVYRKEMKYISKYQKTNILNHYSKVISSATYKN